MTTTVAEPVVWETLQQSAMDKTQALAVEGGTLFRVIAVNGAMAVTFAAGVGGVTPAARKDAGAAPHPGAPPYPPLPQVERESKYFSQEEADAHLKVSEEFRLRAKIAEDTRPRTRAELDAAEAARLAAEEAQRVRALPMPDPTVQKTTKAEADAESSRLKAAEAARQKADDEAEARHKAEAAKAKK